MCAVSTQMNASPPKNPNDFIVGQDDFRDLSFNPALQDSLRHIFNNATKQPVKAFVLSVRPQVKYECAVTLIEKGKKFTPRLALSVRDETGKIRKMRASPGADACDLKARVDLEDCHENFWELIEFLRSLKQVEVPQGRFSLVSHDDAEIISAILRDRDADSLKAIAKGLIQKGISLSQQDVNQLLKRREKLIEFESALTTRHEESWWQDFFEANKWIFGYGLNYQILRTEQAQPHYGGTRVDGAGGQKGDYLASTAGAISFTVLVEIKKPTTSLIQGRGEIRAGAWSLSKDLTDSLSQIESNIARWAESAKEADNRDRFEGTGVYTVLPKGIVVIGSLEEVKNVRSKRDTFERFRKSIHGTEILTFDELFYRAKYIVEQKE
jgi:Domain of unknown function (DUF4263)